MMYDLWSHDILAMITYDVNCGHMVHQLLSHDLPIVQNYVWGPDTLAWNALDV